MLSLPKFNEFGVLPAGDYRLTLSELRKSMLVLGPDGGQSVGSWDRSWRLQLVERLEILVGQLWAVGVDEIFVDGSFVEDKDHPNDIDGYFVCDGRRFASGGLENDLNRLDPQKCWTWSHAARRPYRGYPKRQLPMWHAYRVELYPHFRGLIAGTDEWGNELEFPAWFRRRRTDGGVKGIVQIVKG